MKSISFRHQGFPADAIGHAVWLLFRFSPSFGHVELFVARRAMDVSYETIRFGPLIARRLKRRRPAPSPRWPLDEMVCSISGKRV